MRLILSLISILLLIVSCSAPTSIPSVPNTPDQMNAVLASTDLWITSEILSAEGDDITEANLPYLQLFRYNANDNTYQLFSLEGTQRGTKQPFSPTALPLITLSIEEFTYSITTTEGQPIHLVHRPLFASTENIPS